MMHKEWPEFWSVLMYYVYIWCIQAFRLEKSVELDQLASEA